MAFEAIVTLSTDKTISLGGFNKKEKRDNPTTITGYYIGSKRDIPNKKNPEKPSQLHVFKTKEGNVGVWGKTDLDRKMALAIPGALTRATFTGTVPTDKNDMYCYSVEIDKSDRMDLGSLEESTPAGASYDNGEESSVDEDDVPMDAAPAVRVQAPAKPAGKPDASRAQAYLAGKR